MQMSFVTSVRAAAGLVMGAAAALALATAFANTEAVVARGFSAALETTGAQDARSTTALVSGSEAYWLTPTAAAPGGARIEPVAWALPLQGLALSAGDRLTVSSGGRDRVLEVVSVVPAPAGSTRIDVGQPQGTAATGRRLVTCRELGAQGGDLVRVIIEGEPADQRTAAAHARAL